MDLNMYVYSVNRTVLSVLQVRTKSIQQFAYHKGGLV